MPKACLNSRNQARQCEEFLFFIAGELAFADQKGKRVLPLLHRPCDLPPSFELRFGNVQRADFSRGDYETNLVKLLASIKQVLGLAVATPPPPVKVKKPKPKPDLLNITSPIRLELVRIPAGEFLMGSDKSKDKQAYDNEQPQHRLHVSEFHIGKYPVTNTQYAAFVKATENETPKHWKNGKIPSGKENHPVIHVSWHDVVAFCEWLSQETGKNFRLPTEVEWEKAARGTEGWIYPWGDGLPTAELCNFDNPVGHTTPVGQYSPRGDSPYGCADMAGNVWEWTQSLWGKDSGKPDFGYPYDPGDGREDLDAGSEVYRVLRGGTFSSGGGGASAAPPAAGAARTAAAGTTVFGSWRPPSPSDLWPLWSLGLWNPGSFGFAQGRL